MLEKKIRMIKLKLIFEAWVSEGKEFMQWPQIDQIIIDHFPASLWA